MRSVALFFTKMVNPMGSRIAVASATLLALLAVTPVQAAPVGTQSATPAPQGIEVPVRLAQRNQQTQPAAGNLAGRYAILREENKDSGCLLILNAGGRAQLGPGCRDHGLVVFDPIGWAAGRGAIVLRARKGHRINMVLKDGLYVREPAAGRPFVLRKF